MHCRRVISRPLKTGAVARRHSSPRLSLFTVRPEVEVGHCSFPCRPATCLALQLTEAAEVLFDHGDSNIYSATREEVQEQINREVQQEMAPPQAAPPPAAAAAAAAAIEDSGVPTRRAAAPPRAGAGASTGGADSRAMRGERQLAAAASALPAEGMPSVPGAEREVRGPGQEGAVHGFAAELVRDLLEEEGPVSPLPPQVGP